MRILDDDAEPGGGDQVLYQGSPFTGEVVDYSPDGVMTLLVEYKHGWPDGKWLEWHSDGSPMIEGRCALGKGAVGVWKEWDAAGTLVDERVFDDAGRMISHRKWDSSGDETTTSASEK